MLEYFETYFFLQCVLSTCCGVPELMSVGFINFALIEFSTEIPKLYEQVKHSGSRRLTIPHYREREILIFRQVHSCQALLGAPAHEHSASNTVTHGAGEILKLLKSLDPEGFLYIS